ncbi:MAG: PASTA domain-containing protein [Faecalibacterium sp.]|nr:PASTA domain-containing protein [Ruminococcus sp.]MCM1486095.1 PASTA domain-containing protein [Faecalibacterium sp.]
MAEIQHLCMGCMKPIHESAVICPYCSYNSQAVQHAPYLPKETVLSGRYLVGKTIAFETDSVTYIGFDLQHRRTVQIHEFLPEKIITREEGSAIVSIRLGYERMFYTCIQAFRELWRAVSNIGQLSATETVFDIFDENSTSYAVCEYVDAISLEEYFSSNPPLNFQKALQAFAPIFDTISKLHGIGIIHGAISPMSVVLDSTGRLRLLGLSIAQTKSAIPELHRPTKDGYAPIELYDRSAPLTPSADIYSLAAVLYTSLTGIIPPTASRRALNDTMVMPREIADTLPENMISAIVRAMKIYPAERTKTMDAFQAELFAITTSAPAKEEPANQQEDTKESDSSFSGSLVIKMLVCIFAICAIVFCTMYTTFLYKSMDIPILNSVFGSFSFLPMNMDNDEPTDKADTTTTAPTTTESETVRVADFEGLTQKDVKLNAVYNRNFNIQYEYENSDIYEKDTVIRQSIPKGSTVNLGTTITLTISSGIAKVILRDVIGQNYDIAYIMLTNDGFVVRKETTKNDGSQMSNVVCTMSLVAGLEFEKGTEITLTVWE